MTTLRVSAVGWACVSLGTIAEVAMEATRVTTDELRERMDRGEQFTFLDTRNPKAWAESDEKLPNAIRVPADELGEHLNEIPKDRAVIAYCT